MAVVDGQWAGTRCTCISEASAVVITLVLLGRWLEARQAPDHGGDSALHALRPDMAHLLSRDGEVDVPIAEVMAGWVTAWWCARASASGGWRGAWRATRVDESMLTGEPPPVLREAGGQLTGRVDQRRWPHVMRR